MAGRSLRPSGQSWSARDVRIGILTIQTGCGELRPGRRSGSASMRGRRPTRGPVASQPDCRVDRSPVASQPDVPVDPRTGPQSRGDWATRRGDRVSARIRRDPQNSARGCPSPRDGGDRMSERRRLRASGGQDDHSERPARVCGQPRAGWARGGRGSWSARFVSRGRCRCSRGPIRRRRRSGRGCRWSSPRATRPITRGAAVASILRQDYPDLEVVLVDDRSTDGTGAIADRLATADGRLRVLHVEHLPAGWKSPTPRSAAAAWGGWRLPPWWSRPWNGRRSSCSRRLA
ncbi:MAG: glycosyltransferase family 2 protein [Planctomycetaceae bacterium]